MRNSDSLGDRMKRNYEDVTRQYLIRRMPVIIRLDGRAFHNVTRNCDKPFDVNFANMMAQTAGVLCSVIQNAKIAYTQSDEISILLNDYNTLYTDQWFSGNIQKITSISAAIASVRFTELLGSPAIFDSRVFNVPKEDVNNYFVWRQQDWNRNSIQMLAQAHFSQNSLHGLSCDLLQEKLWQEKQINWSKLDVRWKRGVCVKYEEKHKWCVDLEIPDFTKDHNYIEQFI